MSTLTLFADFHQALPRRATSFLFREFNEAQIRTRPQPTVNSIAWIVWHMARVEDAGVNRFVADRPQVLDEGNWGEQMNIAIRHNGNSMTSEEVSDLSQRIDIPALRAYHEAVRVRSLEVVATLAPTRLIHALDPADLRRILIDEGLLGPHATREPLPYLGLTREVLLFHFGVTHNYGHFYEVFTVCGLLGVPYW
jgi:hypothetical protein